MFIFNTHSAEILILIFLIFTFLQSGFDKISDWKGNVDFISNHLKNTILGKMVPLLLIQILIFEIAAGILMAIGLYHIITSGETIIAKVGLEIAAITLIFLLIGQRLAKDYAGAITITVYFILNVIGIYIINQI